MLSTLKERVAKLEATVSGLREDVNELKASMRDAYSDISEIKETCAQILASLNGEHCEHNSISAKTLATIITALSSIIGAFVGLIVKLLGG